jgi:hypothetical protein
MDLFGRIAVRRLEQPTLRLRPRQAFRQLSEMFPDVDAEPRAADATLSVPLRARATIRGRRHAAAEVDRTLPRRPIAEPAPPAVRSIEHSEPLADEASAVLSGEAMSPDTRPATSPAVPTSPAVSLSEESETGLSLDSSTGLARVVARRYVAPDRKRPSAAEERPGPEVKPDPAERLAGMRPNARPGRGPQPHRVGVPSPPAADGDLPDIVVQIGRVELRAPAAATPPRATAPRGPQLSLQQYLESRHGEGAR